MKRTERLRLLQDLGERVDVRRLRVEAVTDANGSVSEVMLARYQGGTHLAPFVTRFRLCDSLELHEAKLA